MSKDSFFYITTPIYYVNDAPHIGHAYTTVACDVIARFMRLLGRDVFFATGTDEHGKKNAKSAQEKGRLPQEHVDILSENFRRLCEASHSTHTDFIRTTEPRHKEAAQALWNILMAKDQIYLGTYSGWYSVQDEAYYAEGDLVDGKAPTGSSVEWIEEPSYFFRLSAWQEPLLKFYAQNPHFVLPHSRLSETKRFVESGLKDLCVSRTTFQWGIPVPQAPDHIMYVWMDALTNYLTCVGYPDTTAPDFQNFWPASVHVVGKDILRFHAVYWPAFLMAAGLEPPQQVFAHGWLLMDGQKMSKSLGNVLDPFGLYSRYGLDQVRYYLMREIPFGSDGVISHSAIVQRINSDLANDYGNLVQRVLSFLYKNCAGAVPALEGLLAEDQALLKEAALALEDITDLLKQFSLHRIVERIWEVIGAANRYIDHQKPWALRKENPQRMDAVLAVLTDVIRRIAVLTEPITPLAANKVLNALKVPAAQRNFQNFATEIQRGTILTEPKALFPRYEEAANVC